MAWMRKLRVITLLIGAMMAIPLAPAWAAPPPNDTVTGATVISSLPFSDTVDTTEATFDDDASLGTVCPVDPATSFSNSVWYTYTPSADQTIRIDTTSSTYFVAGAVVTGTSGAFTAVEGGCFLGSTVVELVAGTTYYIDLLQFGEGSGGMLQLSITELVTPNAAVTVDPRGSFSKAGTATLTGTASCSDASSAFLFATLTQPVGRISTITASTDPFGPELPEIICDGTKQPWSITLTPFSGLFRGGKAIATVSILACNEFMCDQDEVTSEITLTRDH